MKKCQPRETRERAESNARSAQARQLEHAVKEDRQGGLRLPASECKKHQNLFATEGIVCETLPDGMVFARFPTGTNVWSCPQVNLPSGEKMVVAVGVSDEPNGGGRRIVLVPSDQVSKKQEAPRKTTTPPKGKPRRRTG